MYVFVNDDPQSGSSIATSRSIAVDIAKIGPVRFIAAHTGFALPLSIGHEELLLAGSLAGIGLIIATLPALLSLRRPIAEGLKA